MSEPLLVADHAVVMGILNVTTDSFSDGGRFLGLSNALAHARVMVAEGAHIIDVGGESTRPGAHRVTVDEEQRRVLPLVCELTAEGVAVSIDTLNASTASAAVAAGARFINDVSGGLADPDMTRVAAESPAVFIAGHWRGTPETMNDLAVYDDVVADVRSELTERMDALLTAGLPRERLVLDPGLGFAKTPAHNWSLLAHLAELRPSGSDPLPVLIGASRKRFVGELMPADAQMSERDLPSAVIAALAVHAGAWGVRVHDVRSTRLALSVNERWESAQ